MRGLRRNVLCAGAVFALISWLVPGPALGQAPLTMFHDGKSYQSLSEEGRTQYVLGLFDMMQRMAEVVTEPKTREVLTRFNRCIAGMSAGELREFVDSYLVSDQGAAQYAMASNFLAALGLRCP